MSNNNEDMESRTSLQTDKRSNSKAKKVRFFKRFRTVFLIGIIVALYHRATLNIIHSFSMKLRDNLFPEEVTGINLDNEKYIKSVQKKITVKDLNEAKKNKNKKEKEKIKKDSEKVDMSYFDDAVFLGNSRTETFVLFTGLSNATCYAYKGFSVSKVFEQAIVPINGQKLTVIDALKHTDFSKAYLMYGFNETGWVYPEIFIEKYGKIIDEIKNVNPDATIYVQSIIPVSKAYSNSNPTEGNERIEEYNKLIEQMAKEKGVEFLNVKESVIDSEGNLPADAASDGIHLKREYAEKWLDYLRTNTID